MQGKNDVDITPAERNLRAALNGEEPAAWIIEEMRSGEWERRKWRNSYAILRNMARTASQAREAVSRTRPRERRAASRSTPSRGDPDPESDLPWRRIVAACSDAELIHIVRSFNAVDKAVRGFRGRAA